MALQKGFTPLFMAAWKGNVAMVQVLLGVGANTEAKDTVRGRGREEGR